MHPGFWGYWHARRHAEGAGEDWGCNAGACSPGHGHDRGMHGGRRQRPEWYAAPDDGGGFGVRRPLRFLAHKLELNDDQVAQLATVLSALKTERAQAEVDQRRRTSALANAFEGAEFDAAKVDAAEREQAQSAERLRESVKSSLSQIHALLDDVQRKKFAYLLRTGVLSV
jgi:Spy/CpxP family protein refolding chaperone